MNGRVKLITIGASLILIAPTACLNAAGTGAARGADVADAVNEALNQGEPGHSPLTGRRAQAVVLTEGAAARKPVRTIRLGRKSATASREPHYFLVRRNSI